MKKAACIFLFMAILVAVTLAQEALLYEIPLKLSPEVNSEAEESAVLMSPDEQTLYFSRIMYHGNTGGVKGGQDIWSSAADGKGGWFLAEHNLLSLNNKGDNAVIGISEDGNTLYLLNKYKGKKTAIGVSKAVKDGERWAEPEALDIPGLLSNSPYYGFYMHPSGKYLIISMDSKESVGEEDLYVSKNEGGNWTEPIHIGRSLNSGGFEITPFLTADTHSIYFSSDRYGGYGNADIYKSDRLDETWTKWSIPVNMGDNINSAGFDAFFSITPSSKLMFCSNRSGMLSDIFVTKVLERIVITQKEDAPGLTAVVQEEDLSTTLTGETATSVKKTASVEEDPPKSVKEVAKVVEETVPPEENTAVNPVEVTASVEEETAEPVEEVAGAVEETVPPEENTAVNPVEVTASVEEETAEPVEEVAGVVEEAAVPPEEERIYADVEETSTATVEKTTSDIRETSEPVDAVVPEPVEKDAIAPVFEAPPLENEKHPEKGVLTSEKDEAPVVSKVSARREVDDAGRVFFDLNSSYFSKTEAGKLKSICEKMKSQPNLRLEALGYSDNLGEDHYNMWISERRTNRVIQYMIDKGIDGSRLSGKWFGESNQAVSCSVCTDEQHQANRRVELLFQ